MVEHGILSSHETEVKACTNFGRDSVKSGTILTMIQKKLLSLASFHPSEIQIEKTLRPKSY
jgi:hypothetical protein